MNDETKTKGDIAKALRIIKQIDRSLEMTGDEKTFAAITPGEVEAITNPLLIARMATKNLLRRLGFNSDTVDFPPSQKYRER